jgi:DNA mismatch repair ATPase MutS
MFSWDKIKDLIVDKKINNKLKIIDKFSNESDNIDNIKISSHLCEDIKYITDPINIGKDVYRDIEFFENINNNTYKTSTIYDIINNHTLIGSETISKKVLSLPLNNINLLNERKKLINNIESIYTTDDQNILNEMKDKESDVLWLYQDLEKNMEDLYNIVFFRFALLDPLNSNEYILSSWNIYKILVSPMIGILSPIIYFIVPYLVLLFKFKIKMSFVSYLKMMYQTMTNQEFLLGSFSKNKGVRVMSLLFSLLFYFQNFFNSIEISKTLYKMSSYLVNRMNNVVLFLKNAEKIINKFWSPFILGNYINKENLTLIPSEEEYEYIKLLDPIDFKLFSNFGKQLKNYKSINKEIITSVLSKVYIIDSILSIIKFKQKHNLVYTEFIDADKPTITIDNLWHPCINKERVVTNDIKIGNTTDNPNNIIITGTNAAGKSLLIKSLLVNTLIAQTCTLSVSTNCRMTPFSFINSQISIPDCTGFESLFQAEMHRCKNNLDSLCKLPKNKLALIIIDEIFNSTNPVEAIAGGFAICKKISNYENTIMIFTTHFSYLTKLSKATNKFKNYRMETIVDKDNINFTYKLKKGINKQYIALELLKKEGFDADIIDEAITIKDKLL